MMLRIRSHFLLFGVVIFASAAAVLPVQADGRTEALMRLLNGRPLPPERLEKIVEQICARGDAEDLQAILDRATTDPAWSSDLKAKVFSWLADAARSRRVVPAGDGGAVLQALDSGEPSLRIAAIRLAGQWGLSAAEDQLEALSLTGDESPDLQQEALRALALVNPSKAESTATALCDDPSDPARQRTGLQLLVELNLAQAADRAATLMAQSDDERVAGIIVPFLARQGGAEALAEEFEQRPPSREWAKLILQRIHAQGRSDIRLTAVLSRAAGWESDRQITVADIPDLVQEAAAAGNPARGEEVFRRADLSCQRCHAINKAGGQIGPDLSAVGVSSSLEYLLMSVINPDQSIKEAYTTTVISTLDGRIHHGIVASRTPGTIVLSTAAGETISIPASDVDEEAPGRSLMPQGLVRFLSRQDLIDLATFLSRLGQPGGEYAVRTTQRLQRYQVLNKDEPFPPELGPDEIRNDAGWKPVYAKTNGELPLNEFANAQDSLYVAGEIDCTRPGMVEIRLNSTEGLEVWLNAQKVAPVTPMIVALEQGRRQLLFRIHQAQRDTRSLSVEATPASGSSAEFFVVDGP